MVYRAVSALIILFWLFMMGLLVRRSFFPEETVFAQLPCETVLRAVLNCTEQPDLVIRDTRRHTPYEKKGVEIGQWRLQVSRVQRTVPTPLVTLAPPVHAPGMEPSWVVVPTRRQGSPEWKAADYLISNDVIFYFDWNGDFQFNIKTQCYLEPNLDVVSFATVVRIGQKVNRRLEFADILKLSGDRSSGKIRLESTLPGLQDWRPSPSATVRNAALGQLLGLGSLQNLPLFTQSPSAAAGPPVADVLPRNQMICREELVPLGTGKLRSYVVENRYGDHFRVTLYVSRQGEIWKVKMPFGIEMESDTLNLLR